MSPDFNRFKEVLLHITDRYEEVIDLKFREDISKSTSTTKAIVVYVYFGGEDWEYHWFYIPTREFILAKIEFDEFVDNIL